MTDTLNIINTINHTFTNTGAFSRPYTALIIGASGTIGSAFLSHMQLDSQCQQVVGLSRSNCPGFDLCDENSVAHLAAQAALTAPYDLIIDATGALTIHGQGPEKSLSALNQAKLLQAFQVNTIGPALLLRHLAPLLASQGGIYAKLSARVGSITDNTKGGWYGYRASKAAFNMVLHTAALELQRRQPRHQLVALQPGTVVSPLSQAFVGLDTHTVTAQQSVKGMMAALAQLPTITGAHFVDYRGNTIAW